ncbi:general negative regulator of transcription subunit 5, partial [Quaeritorhiza haematococci]
MANRKLQSKWDPLQHGNHKSHADWGHSEIERVLKKVAEGVEIFEGIFDKIQQASNAAQKEKFEGDLKKEIKKLQRYRDQIKTWLSSNEIKDKRVLLENRKLIEQQMEKFKACEKELKTKAYSKEGLSQSAKVDPLEKEKAELGGWVTETVDKLSTQVDAFEAEAEILQAAIKKSRKVDSSKAERLAQVEHQVERHKFHITKLEIILRMLENGALTIDQVRDIKDDVNFYVESNQDPEFAEDEGIYDELNLEDAEAFGFANDDEDESSETSDDEPAPPPKEKEEPKLHEDGKRKGAKDGKDNEATSPSKPSPSKQAVVRGIDKTKPPAKAAPLPQPKVLPPSGRSSSVTLPAPRPSQIESAPAPHITQRYSVAAAAQPVDSARGSISSVSSGTPTTEDRRILGKVVDSPTQAPIPAPRAPSEASPTVSVASPTKPPSGPSAIPQYSNATAASVPPSSAQQQRGSTTTASTITQQQIPPLGLPIPSSTKPLGPSQQAPIPAPAPTSTTTPTAATAPVPTEAPQTEAPPPTESIDDRLPPSVADLVSSFEATKERLLTEMAYSPAALKAREDTSFLQHMLDTSAQFVPDALDSERPKYYMAKNPYPTPGYYPQTPLGVFENPLIFEKFDIDTLFFIFYYQQGTYQQYLAARELKRQSWRFHKKYLTWFQRHEEPKAITDEYEQGTYIYFDYEGAWCQRKKTEF